MMFGKTVKHKDSDSCSSAYFSTTTVCDPFGAFKMSVINVKLIIFWYHDIKNRSPHAK